MPEQNKNLEVPVITSGHFSEKRTIMFSLGNETALRRLVCRDETGRLYISVKGKRYYREDCVVHSGKEGRK